MAHPLAGLERLDALADPLAAAWAARARASTTVGRERAILRAFGVGGLDRDGRPLAWSVVDRWLAGEPSRLGAGIALPFAICAFTVIPLAYYAISLRHHPEIGFSEFWWNMVTKGPWPSGPMPSS